MSRTILKKFGKKVRVERLKKRLTQGELAKKARISRVYLWMIETGKKSTTVVIIERIAKALQLKIGDLTDI